LFLTIITPSKRIFAGHLPEKFSGTARSLAVITGWAKAASRPDHKIRTPAKKSAAARTVLFLLMDLTAFLLPPEPLTSPGTMDTTPLSLCLPGRRSTSAPLHHLLFYVLWSSGERRTAKKSGRKNYDSIILIFFADFTIPQTPCLPGLWDHLSCSGAIFGGKCGRLPLDIVPS
jgi:hypothetical protein